MNNRLREAINCRKPDRIPIALRIEYAAALWAKISFSEFALNPKKASDALEYSFNTIGGWDLIDASWTLGTRWTKLEATKVEMPGTDFSDKLPHRVIDYPVMKHEDYDFILKEGINSLIVQLMKRLGKKYDENSENTVFKSFTPIYRHWENKGVQVYRGGMVRPPFVQFSMWRTWKGIAKDFLSRKEKLKEVSDLVWKDLVKIGENQSKIVGCDFVFIPCGRASTTFLSERFFLEYFFPYLKSSVKELVNNGFTPRIHCDGDWLNFLEFFLELPKKSCILELGHETSIEKAKKILGGHMCLYGNVPRKLLLSGSSSKVEEYCKKLIENVGKDGFILANDDIVPYNSKLKNVKMLIESGKKFG